VSAVLIDAGPLVALINGRDADHRICRDILQSIRDPLATVWPAFTEAMYLLRTSWQAQQALWRFVEAAPVELISLFPRDFPRVRELMRKYRDLPMDLADAALVRVAERDRLRRIFTLDKRDFSVYRPSRLGRFVIMP